MEPPSWAVAAVKAFEVPKVDGCPWSEMTEDPLPVLGLDASPEVPLEADAKKLLLDWNASDKRNKHVALRRAFIAIFRAAGNYSTFCLMTLIGLENAGFLSVTEQQHTAFSPLAL